MCCSVHLFGLYAAPWNEAIDMCTRFPPKRVQQGVVDRFGIETLAGGGQATTALHASQLQPKVCILLQYA
jgi:hypothetical protein